MYLRFLFSPTEEYWADGEWEDAATTGPLSLLGQSDKHLEGTKETNINDISVYTYKYICFLFTDGEWESPGAVMDNGDPWRSPSVIDVDALSSAPPSSPVGVHL